MNLEKISKYISLLLRHKPSEENLTLDEHGWCNVDELVSALDNRYKGFTMSDLETIVSTDEKSRYSFNNDKTLIRANQGHSIPVDVELEEIVPPDVLYHGTAKKSLDSILKIGLRHMSRLYVHLSADIETAHKVGSRHGDPVIFLIDAKQMYEDGFVFYQSVNKVWLIDNVPSKYLKLIKGEQTNE